MTVVGVNGSSFVVSLQFIARIYLFTVSPGLGLSDTIMVVVYVAHVQSSRKPFVNKLNVWKKIGNFVGDNWESCAIFLSDC